MVKVDAGGNQDDKDRSGYPVDDEAERRPSTRVCDELTAVLPQVLQPMACEAHDEQPRRPGNGRGGDNDEDRRDTGLDDEHASAPVGDREADVDRRDQDETECVDRGRVKPPEGQR